MNTEMNNMVIGCHNFSEDGGMYGQNEMYEGDGEEYEDMGGAEDQADGVNALVRIQNLLFRTSNGLLASIRTLTRESTISPLKRKQ
jgi:hypothetical protein